MRTRFAALSGALCSSLFLGGMLTLIPLHGEYDGATPRLYLSSTRGITAIDPSSGQPAFTANGAVASGDWQHLLSATPTANGTTTVRSIDAFDGDAGVDTVLDGTLGLRAVSFRGDLVALSPDARAVHGRQPGRSSTKIVIASTIGGVATRTFDLAANVEPEALSTDGGALFVIQYLPATDPDRYQVRRLDLTTGALTLVTSVDGANQGQMPGIARTSVMAPDGRRLYTLYTSQENGQRYSFVHVLDLDRQWAHCIDLPPSFGADPAAMGIAIDPSGGRVYVADVAAGKLAAIDTRAVALDNVSRMPIRSVHAPPAVAAGLGRVYVAAQRNLVALATGTSLTYFHSTLESPVRGLHVVPVDGTTDRLYVAERRGIAQLDTRNGDQVSIVAARTPRLSGLGYQYPPASGESIKCAC